MSYISLAVYVISMMGAGVFVYRRSTNDMSGYTPDGKHISPQNTALSAGGI